MRPNCNEKMSKALEDATWYQARDEIPNDGYNIIIGYFTRLHLKLRHCSCNLDRAEFYPRAATLSRLPSRWKSETRKPKRWWSIWGTQQPADAAPTREDQHWPRDSFLPRRPTFPPSATLFGFWASMVVVPSVSLPHPVHTLGSRTHLRKPFAQVHVLGRNNNSDLPCLATPGNWTLARAPALRWEWLQAGTQRIDTTQYIRLAVSHLTGGLFVGERILPRVNVSPDVPHRTGYRSRRAWLAARRVPCLPSTAFACEMWKWCLQRRTLRDSWALGGLEKLEEARTDLERLGVARTDLERLGEARTHSERLGSLPGENSYLCSLQHPRFHRSWQPQSGTRLTASHPLSVFWHWTIT